MGVITMNKPALTITYHGQQLVLKHHSTLNDFMDDYVDTGENCIIFVNNKFIPPDKYDTYYLKDEDAIVKVTFMPGG
jgi:thiamine biosynthesis protein ThiS